MIVTYDRNDKLTANQKLQSLQESVQMALNELELRIIELERENEKLREVIKNGRNC